MHRTAVQSSDLAAKGLNYTFGRFIWQALVDFLVDSHYVTRHFLIFLVKLVGLDTFEMITKMIMISITGNGWSE